MGGDGELLGQLAGAEDLDVRLRVLEQALLDERFDVDGVAVCEDAVEKGLLKNTKADVKILGTGELKKKLAVTAHAFSASAREKITAAGGSATALKEPADPRKKKSKAKPKPVAAEEEPEVAETEDAENEETAPAAEEE